MKTAPPLRPADKARIGATKFGRVQPPWWDDRPVFIIGGGSSLKGRDLSRLREQGWVVGVNRAADFWPVDATFTLDMKFAREYASTLEKWAKQHEVYLCLPSGSVARSVPGAVYLERVHLRGVTTNRSQIAQGLHSGYGAVNLALLKQARKIVLLGIDLDLAGHWHDGYSWDRVSSRLHGRYYDRWADRFADVARHLPKVYPGVEIVNANPKSKVKAFPFASYKEFGL
jgi:hypothetical protein